MYKLHISYFSSIYDNKIKYTDDTTWESFKSTIINKHTVTNKKDFMLFNGMVFKDTLNDGFVRRCADNVQAITLLILDYDGDETVNSIKSRLGGYEHAGYTSYSHHTERKDFKDCFRVVLPLKCPITLEEMKERKDDIARWAGAIDETSTDISRGFYLPSCSAETLQYAETWDNNGEFLDLLSFTVKSANLELISFNETDVSDEKLAMIKEALSVITLGYEPEWVKVCWAMKNAGFTVNDFIDVTCNGSLMDSKSVEDCQKRWQKADGKTTNTGYLVNLIRKHGNPEFMKKQQVDNFKKLKPKEKNIVKEIVQEFNTLALEEIAIEKEEKSKIKKQSTINTVDIMNRIKKGI